MPNHIMLNDTKINVDHYQDEMVSASGKELLKIVVDFKVNHEAYHAITTLLYELNFDVSVPEKNLAFRGTVHNYSTSVTNLYEEDAVGDFHLELIELKQ
ncbi:DUF3219 family protein [Jeotgalibacillus soli]|uniref:DUF3219 domain-containing protein n=1 Tax=Jeotgalibacillus soli TaxID=889306 RepID=A0A0C2VK15_9BACL|nr:DUF3219 family protein [Jeotgalibacillus soli]KIL44338.1 hypothetical protein KP78_33020 [Jeotgalibacillus soli]